MYLRLCKCYKMMHDKNFYGHALDLGAQSMKRTRHVVFSYHGNDTDSTMMLCLLGMYNGSDNCNII